MEKMMHHSFGPPHSLPFTPSLSLTLSLSLSLFFYCSSHLLRLEWNGAAIVSHFLISPCVVKFQLGHW